MELFKKGKSLLKRHRKSTSSYSEGKTLQAPSPVAHTASASATNLPSDLEPRSTRNYAHSYHAPEASPGNLGIETQSPQVLQFGGFATAGGKTENCGLMALVLDTSHCTSG